MMKKTFLHFIRLYQKYLSPALPPSCRFYPSCSVYAYEAVSRYGAFTGSLMGLWRILRCNPFSKGGYDPVPGRILRKKRRTRARRRTIVVNYDCAAAHTNRVDRKGSRSHYRPYQRCSGLFNQSRF